MSNESMRLHSIVQGHVQGVGFRYFVINQAQILNLTGWVRNLSNGDVEIMAEGKPLELEQLIGKLIIGSSGSHVLIVTQDWLPPENAFKSFSIKPTN
jgi:acylphosphatase